MEISKKRAFLKLNHPNILFVLFSPFHLVWNACVLEEFCFAGSWVVLSPLDMLIKQVMLGVEGHQTDSLHPDLTLFHLNPHNERAQFVVKSILSVFCFPKSL